MAYSPELTKVGFAPAAVSVLMPVYNREQYVIETIRSIENQNFRDYKLVIYDDGSTDKTESICQHMAAGTARIQYVRGGQHPA
jgi:CDP-glycerol glycerophosphotransferase